MPPVAHASGCYWVNLGTGFPTAVTGTGTIQRQCNPLLAASLKVAGWHGPFSTFDQAKAYINSQSKSGVQSAESAANKVNPLGGIQAIGDFFNRLTEANTWIRVGEVAAGLLLLYLGLNAAMKGTSAGNAIQSGTETVRKTGKRAVETAGFIPK